MRYGVLGGGVLGLTAGLRLAQAGHHVTVFERAAVPGGLASSFEVAPGIWLERFYHHLFASDSHAISLINELGLRSQLEWHRPVTTVFVDGRVIQLDSPASVLRFDPLPVPSRLHLAFGLAVLRLLPSPRLLGDRTTGDLLPRLMGRRAHAKVWRPLLRGKFGPAGEDIAMPWMWARIHSRTPQLGYMRGGFHQLYTALADAFTSAGGVVTYNADVQRVSRADSGLGVEVSDGSVATFDRVVSTLPAVVTARLAGFPPTYLDRHRPPESLGAHCLVLELDRPLTDVYWIGVNDESMPFLALVEHTNMASPSDYGGRHLVYLGNYRPMDDSVFATPPEQLLEEWVPALRRIRPDFSIDWVRSVRGFAAPFAQPIVRAGYAATIPSFTTPMDGLYLATMFQVYPHDRGQNYSIALAERLVRMLSSELAS